MNIKEIKIHYYRLLGLVDEAPRVTDNNYFYGVEESIVQNYLSLIDDLCNITSENLDKFRLPINGSTVGDYRSQLSNLKGYIYAKYLEDDVPSPFFVPSAGTTISQSQTQTININFILEIKEIIDKKLPQTEEGSNENKFLKALNEKIKQVHEPLDLLKTILDLATHYGLPIATVLSLFN